MKYLLVLICLCCGCKSNDAFTSTFISSNNSAGGVVEQVLYHHTVSPHSDLQLIIMQDDGNRIVYDCFTDEDINLWKRVKIGDRVILQQGHSTIRL